jgi:elongation factor G
VSPNPSDIKGVATADGKEVTYDASAPTSLFVFKTSYEEHIGKVNYFKVRQGTLTENQDLINVSHNKTKERFAQIFSASGKNRHKVEKLVAGDIGATVKLKTPKTNHTINAAGLDFEFPKIEMPQSKIHFAVKNLKDGEEEKLGEAFNQLQDEDLSISVEFSKELKQTLLYGQGEYHLNIVKWHLDHIFKVETEYLAPKIPYRETITKTALASYRHKKQSGGSGQFGEVSMVIEPYTEGMADPTMYKIAGKEIKITLKNKQEIELDWGGKLIFYNSIVGGVIDAKFMPAILKGIMEKIIRRKRTVRENTLMPCDGLSIDSLMV